MKQFLHRLGSPQFAYNLAGACLPWLSLMCITLMIYGVVGGLFLAPTDRVQGDAFRMIYIHVPAAFLSLTIYAIIFVNSIIYLVWHIKVADIIAKTSASIGATYTFIALFTGALWGKPMWGTWWIWDARLTSELILLFLYIGFLSLHAAIEDVRRADRAAALLALVGAINVPIIYFSVKWWNTLHQGASVSMTRSPSMASIMLIGMLIMSMAAWMYAIGASFLRVRAIIAEREQGAQWLQ